MMRPSRTPASRYARSSARSSSVKVTRSNSPLPPALGGGAGLTACRDRCRNRRRHRARMFDFRCLSMLDDGLSRRSQDLPQCREAAERSRRGARPHPAAADHRTRPVMPPHLRHGTGQRVHSPMRAAAKGHDLESRLCHISILRCSAHPCPDGTYQWSNGCGAPFYRSACNDRRDSARVLTLR